MRETANIEAIYPGIFNDIFSFRSIQSGKQPFKPALFDYMRKIKTELKQFMYNPIKNKQPPIEGSKN